MRKPAAMEKHSATLCIIPDKQQICSDCEETLALAVPDCKQRDTGVAAELHALAASRRSVRRLRAQPVEREILDRLFRTAGQAPSAHNRQPWRFAVLEDAAWKARLATAMGDQLRADRAADGDAAEAIERDAARSYARITQAPVVVVACADMRDMDRYPDPRRQTAEHLMAVQSTAMAVQNLLLAAHAEGLGACMMCAPLFCGDAVLQALDLPGGWQPQSLIALGWPANAGRFRDRYDLDAIVWRPAEPR
jgi:F420 biosynthesis protein FbiB-like protein